MAWEWQKEKEKRLLFPSIPSPFISSPLLPTTDHLYHTLTWSCNSQCEKPQFLSFRWILQSKKKSQGSKMKDLVSRLQGGYKF